MSPATPLRLPAARRPDPPARVDPEFNAAKRLYAEQYGDAIVSSWHWKLGFLAMSMVALGLLYFNFKTMGVLSSFKPIVVRVDTVGRAEAVKYDDITYKPEAQTIKYFLSEFCQLYYGRNRFAIQENFQKSLLFMEDRLRSGVTEAWRKNDTIQQYVKSTSPADIEIVVKQVAIEELRTAPYKASVEFDQVFYDPFERTEKTRLSYAAHFIFVFRETIPNQMILVNPLGIAITYFREDAGFKAP